MRDRLHVLAYLKSALAVAVVSIAADALTRLAPLPHVSVLFLAAVIVSAALRGLGPSLFAAVLSVAGGTYFFYSPIYSFAVASSQDAGLTPERRGRQLRGWPRPTWMGPVTSSFRCW